MGKNIIIFIIFFCSSSFVFCGINITYSPDSADINLSMESEGEVTIDIYHYKGEFIKNIANKCVLEKGENIIKWDYKDEYGKTVPDSAYFPLVKIQTADGSEIASNPFLEKRDPVKVKAVFFYVKKGKIEYLLKQNALVRVRIGKIRGDVVKTLVNWEPRSKGRKIEIWDKRDSVNNVVSELRNVTFSINAMSLPATAIFAETGVKDTNYFNGKKLIEPNLYVKANCLPRRIFGLSEPDRESGAARIGQNKSPLEISYLFCQKPLSECCDVSLSIEILNSDAIKENIVTDELRFRIDLNDRYVKEFLNQRYKIHIFIDDVYVCGENEGYIPFTYSLNIKNLSVGKHRLTINLRGLEDVIAVGNVEFNKEGDKEYGISG
jgi:hypothetical protein